MKPDRFTKIVEHKFSHFYHDTKHEFAKLLRLQFAQIRLVVVKESKRHWRGEHASAMNIAHCLACHRILTKLDAYKRRTP